VLPFKYRRALCLTLARRFTLPQHTGLLTTAADPQVNQGTVDAVANDFAMHRGEHYSPQVTIGVGTIGYLDALLDSPFPTCTFSASGASALTVRKH
jgi:hypothetical protein